LKLLLDFNLSPRLVELIEDLFSEVRHLQADGFEGETSDEPIWQFARESGYAIVTCDADFVVLARRYGQPPKIIHLESMNYRTRVAAELIRTNAVLIAKFENDGRAMLSLRLR
jgi:predicted nuclease of predicted toxin-antitoxin system